MGIKKLVLQDMDQVPRITNEKFPVRCLLIDISSPWTLELNQNVSVALSHLFALIHNTAATNRIPAISIFVLGHQIECIFPLQAVKPNHAKLIRAIQEILFQKIGEKSDNEHQADMSTAVGEALGQFRRTFLADKKFPGSYAMQLELCLVTCKSRVYVERCLGNSLDAKNLENLKKIQIIQIEQARNEINLLESSQGLDALEVEEDPKLEDTISDYLEIIKLSGDQVELEQVFKSWLVDCGADDVQLIITVKEKGEQGMKLKCDVNDRLLSLFALPNHPQKLFQAGHQQSSSCSHCVSSRTSTVPVCHFQVNQLVNSDGICESVIYGQPLVVRPTSCWKLDWEELDINQQRFQAVRTFLIQEKMCMLLESEDTHQTSSTAFCILVPSENCGMLLKCVADNDLLLPLANSLCIQKQTDDVQKEMDSLLLKLPRTEALNPLELKAGIAERILSMLQSNDTRRTGKGTKRPISGNRFQSTRGGKRQQGNGGADTNYNYAATTQQAALGNNYSIQKKVKSSYKVVLPNKRSIFSRDPPEFPEDF